MDTINGFVPMNAAHDDLGEDFYTNLSRRLRAVEGPARARWTGAVADS